MKKKSLKIIVAIIAIIVIVAVGIVAIKAIITNNQINNAETKLSQMNQIELKEKIINGLNETALNVNTTSLETTFGTIADCHDSSTPMIYYDIEVANYNTSGKDYIYAFVKDKNNSSVGVAIPCFKIESTDDGKVKNIIFPMINGDSFAIGKTVGKVVEEVLKQEYDIDYTDFKLGKGICLTKERVNIMIMENETEDFSSTVFMEILNNTDGYSWRETLEDEIRNDEALVLEQEVFGVDTLHRSEMYI